MYQCAYMDTYIGRCISCVPLMEVRSGLQVSAITLYLFLGGIVVSPPPNPPPPQKLELNIFCARLEFIKL